MNIATAEALRVIVSTAASARNNTTRLLGEIARLALLGEGEAVPDPGLSVPIEIDDEEFEAPAPATSLERSVRAKELAAQRTRTWRAKTTTVTDRHGDASRTVTVTPSPTVTDRHGDASPTVTDRHGVSPPGSPLSENLPGISNSYKITGDLGSETRARAVTLGDAFGDAPGTVTDRHGDASRTVTVTPSPTVTDRHGKPPPPVVQIPLQSSSLRNMTADGAGGLAVTAWCDGIRSVNAKAVVLTPRGTELAKLCEALVAVEPDPGQRTQKAFADGAAYAQARKGEKISAHGYVDWLQGERSERGSGIRKVLLQPASPHWKVGLPSGAR